MLLQGGPTPYLASLRRMREALPELRTIVPGHGPVGDGPAAIDWLVGYLEACPSPFADGLDPQVASTVARYQLPQDVDRHRLLELMRNLHRLNVLACSGWMSRPSRRIQTGPVGSSG